jgi:hypothetical protein
LGASASRWGRCEALKRYLALPSTGPLKTIAAWKAHQTSIGGDPRFTEMN